MLTVETPTPYIGVTGFMRKEEVAAACDALDSLPQWSDRLLMIGVLASSKTLAGEKNKWPNRYPNTRNLATLFPPHRRALNLIHYATDDPHTLDDQLEALIALGGRYLDGFQLNVCWPEPSKILVPTAMRIVLQLGRRALEETGNDPQKTANCLDAYRQVITDVLVDASGGLGVPIDLKAAKKYIRAISSRHPHLGIGVAGGLSPKTVGELQHLTKTFPRLSVDAEGRLRTPENHLDIPAMKTYIYISMADGLFD